MVTWVEGDVHVAHHVMAANPFYVLPARRTTAEKNASVTVSTLCRKRQKNQTNTEKSA